MEQVLKWVSLENLRGTMRVSSIFSMLKNGETPHLSVHYLDLRGVVLGKIREILEKALDVQKI